MDKKNIQSILRDALEGEIPSEEIKLWPAVKADLVVGNSTLLQRGENMNRTRPRYLLKATIIALLAVVLLVAVFLTPRGRAFAQNIIQFFTRTESTSFELEPLQIVTEEPDLTAPTVAAPDLLISAVEAEAQVGFDVAELPAVPEGFNYLGVRLYGDAINIEYQAQGGRGGSLNIMQSPDGFYQSEWDRVPTDAIVPVTPLQKGSATLLKTVRI